MERRCIVVPITEEQIQRLSDHAGISLEQAKAALEATDGDPLDALTWLEQQGIIPSSGVCSYATDHVAATAAQPMEEAPESPEPEKKEGWIATIWNWSVDNRLEVYRKEDCSRRLECPMAAFLALIALAWWLVALLLVIGFFAGWRYRLVGPHLGRNQVVQDVMEKIDDGAETVIDQVKRNIRPKH